MLKSHQIINNDKVGFIIRINNIIGTYRNIKLKIGNLINVRSWKSHILCQNSLKILNFHRIKVGSATVGSFARCKYTSSKNIYLIQGTARDCSVNFNRV